MKFFECWCCEFFHYLEVEESKNIDFCGICKLKGKKVYGHGDVCKSFMVKQGLHKQTRIILT